MSLSEKSQSERLISIIRHSIKGKTMETVKGLVVAKGWVSG